MGRGKKKKRKERPGAAADLPARAPASSPRRAGRRGRRLLLAALIAGAAVVAGLVLWVRSDRLPAPRHSILLISVDTLRVDKLGAYGYSRPTSPNIDALAGAGILFTDAICQNTNTNPSHASILSGYYPRTHGSWDNFYLMNDDTPLFQEVFRRTGARTAAFVSGYTLKNEICGLARGFDVYDDDFTGKERRGDLTTDRALAWLRDNADRPFFLFVHLFDPHGPYVPPPEFASAFPALEPPQPVTVDRIPRYQRLPRGVPDDQVITDLQLYKARYDGEIAFSDHQVGRLLDALDDLGLADDTIVLLTSDHGEAHDERTHLLDHGGGIGDEEIRVPLILRLPGGHLAGTVFPGQVQSIDITPTLASAAGLTYPHATQGKNLLRLAEVGGPSAHAHALTETRVIPFRWRDRPYDLRRGDTLKSVRTPQSKLVVFPGQSSDYREYYDLETDPLETRNLARERPGDVRRLLERLARFMSMPTRHNTAADPDDDPETRDIFCTLGYVDCED